MERSTKLNSAAQKCFMQVRLQAHNFQGSCIVSGVIVRLTKSPGAIFNSEAGPKGEGQEPVVTRT
jgi:hypothetical protein